MVQSLDLTPLTEPITRGEVASWRSSARASGSRWAFTPALPIVGSVLVALLAGGFLVLVAVRLLDGPPVGVGEALLGAVTFIGVAGGSVALIIVFVRTASRPWRRWARLAKFAAANGLEFDAEAPAPYLPGAIFRAGENHRVAGRLQRDAAPRLDLGNITASFGSSRGRHTRSWGYLAIELDRRLPHMLLDSRRNNTLFGTSNLPLAFRRDQVLSLEGDFDRHFTLYCPKEYERDALSVFTPDLMALLIDDAAPFDVEIADDWMFAYSRRPLRLDDPRTMQRLIRVVDTVGAKALRQTARYRDERADERGAIAPGGRRLRFGVAVGSVVVIAVLVLSWIVAIGVPALVETG